MGDWYPEEFPDNETTKLAVREVNKKTSPVQQRPVNH